jgi:hypothetical protein
MKTTIFCLFCLLFSGELMAQDIFLYQDKSCIDRYEYRFSEKKYRCGLHCLRPSSH